MLVWLLACGPKIDPGPVPVDTWNAPVPLVVDATTSERVDLVAMVRAGSGFDPVGQEGLAALVARSRADQGEPALDVEVDTEWVTLRLGCTRPQAPTCLDRFSRALADADLTDDDWARLRAQAVDRIEAPSSWGSSLVEQVLHDLLFEGHRTGHPFDGRTGVLPTLTPDHGVAFFERHYRRATMVVGLASDDPTDATTLRTALGAVTRGPPVDDAWMRPPAPADRTLVHVEDAPAPGVALGTVLRLAPDHPDLPALHIAVAALDARLRRALGPRATDVRASLALGSDTNGPTSPLRRNPALYVVARPATPEQVTEVLTTAVATVERWQADGLFDAELDRFHAQLVATWQSPPSLLDRVAAMATRFPDGMARTTIAQPLLRAQVDAAVDRWVKSDALQMVVTGDPGVFEDLGVASVVTLGPTERFR